jgi:hypothetical protein
MGKISMALGLAALVLTTAHAPAQARDGIGAGGAAALGVLGGLAVGGAIAQSQNGYYPGQPIYRASPPRRVIVEDEEICHVERRVSVDAYGDEHIRRVRVCE